MLNEIEVPIIIRKLELMLGSSFPSKYDSMTVCGIVDQIRDR